MRLNLGKSEILKRTKLFPPPPPPEKVPLYPHRLDAARITARAGFPLLATRPERRHKCGMKYQGAETRAANSFKLILALLSEGEWLEALVISHSFSTISQSISLYSMPILALVPIEGSNPFRILEGALEASFNNSDLGSANDSGLVGNLERGSLNNFASGSE
jgi:hypothetical protein